jgi:hypothetical protein
MILNLVRRGTTIAVPIALANLYLYLLDMGNL